MNKRKRSCSDDFIYSCEFTDLGTNSDLTSEMISSLGMNPVSYHNFEDGLTTHMLYSDARLEVLETGRRVLEESHKWASMGVSLSHFNVRKIRREEWAESWKKFFKVMRVSSRITVKPAWIEYSPRDEKEIIIDIDPGMSFGPGKHATTKFCLRLLQHVCRRKPAASFLDVGCGSGILMIAALKMGVPKAHGIDNDPLSIDVAKENLIKNGIATGKFSLSLAGIEDAKLRLNSDCVAANIISSVISKNADKLLSFVKPGGSLVVSGILPSEYPEIKEKLECLGAREIKSLSDGEWSAGLFEK